MQSKRLEQIGIGITPEKWETKKIKDVTLKIFSGGTPNTQKQEYWNGNLPWLSSGETRQIFIRGTEKTISSEGVKNSSTRFALKEDVVVAAAGQGYTRGQVSFLQIDTYINQSIVALRADKQKLLPFFLFYNLLARYDELRRISDAHSSRGSLTTKLLADLDINLPTLEEQGKISEILSGLDLKIELNQCMNKTLGEMSSAVFKHWFIDFEFPNEEGRPYRSSGGELVDSDLGKIPKGWKTGELAKYVDIVKGCSYRSDDLKESQLALVTLKSFNRGGGFNQEGYKEYVGPYDAEQVVKDGEVIVAQTDLTQKAEVIGRPAIVNSLEKYSKLVASLDLQIVRPGDNFSRNYLYYLLATEDFHNHALSYTNGTTVLHLSKNAVPNYLAVIPPKEILNMFDRITDPVFNKIAANDTEMVTLSQLRDSILPQLIAGKMRVPIEAT